jgi:hypothetical protein
MTITFWRQEAENVNGVLYLPRDDKAVDLCKLLNRQFIRGEHAMDEIYCLMDKLGVNLAFYETTVSLLPRCEMQDELVV